MSLLLALQGGGGYTLTAETGSIPVAGADTTVAFNRTLSASAGALGISGADASLVSHRVLSAESGAVSVNGSDATLTHSTTTVDVKVSWLAFDTAATPVDVKVSWVAFDTAATPCDVRVSWVCFDTDAVTAVRHRRHKYYSKAYLKRENEILVFDSEAEKQAFIDAEEQAKTAINRAARRKVIATKPKPVIVDLTTVKQEAKQYEIPGNIQALLAQHDYSRILEIHLMVMEMQEEDDLELLLLA